MEEKQQRTKVVVTGLALVGLLIVALHAIAGDLEPNAPPAPTMHTLDEIYDAIVSASPSILQREGYCKKIVCPAGGKTTTILTAPTGRRFVLRKLGVYPFDSEWVIAGGPNLSMDSLILY